MPNRRAFGGRENSTARFIGAPHCNQACMSSLQKLFTGPANSVICHSCGKGVSIRWRHFFFLLVPVAHIWLQSAQSWVEIDRDLFRCFPQEPDDETALARLWQEQMARD